jgi:hypothetical protein
LHEQPGKQRSIEEIAHTEETKFDTFPVSVSNLCLKNYRLGFLQLGKISL